MINNKFIIAKLIFLLLITFNNTPCKSHVLSDSSNFIYPRMNDLTSNLYPDFVWKSNFDSILSIKLFDSDSNEISISNKIIIINDTVFNYTSNLKLQLNKNYTIQLQFLRDSTIYTDNNLFFTDSRELNEIMMEIENFGDHSFSCTYFQGGDEWHEYREREFTIETNSIKYDYFFEYSSGVIHNESEIYTFDLNTYQIIRVYEDNQSYTKDTFNTDDVNYIDQLFGMVYKGKGTYVDTTVTSKDFHAIRLFADMATYVIKNCNPISILNKYNKQEKKQPLIQIKHNRLIFDLMHNKINSIKIYNLAGRNIATVNVSSQKGNVTLPLSTSSGIFIIEYLLKDGGSRRYLLPIKR